MFEPYSDYNAEISVKTSSGQEYTITLYDGRREIANTGTGEEINSKFEEDNKYFIKVTLEPNSYYNPNRSFTIKISPSIPMGADAEHAYTITEGRNGGSRPYESLYPADEYDSLAKQELLEDYGYSQEVWFSSKILRQSYTA